MSDSTFGGRTRARGVAVGLVAALLLGSAACGGTQSRVNADALRRAVARTVAAGSARVATGVDLGGAAGLPGGAVQTGTGVVEFATGRGHYTIDLSTLSNGLFPTAVVEMVTDGKAVFVRPQGNPVGVWTSIDPALLGTAGGTASPNAAQPAAALDAIRRFVGAVTKRGDEDVRGVKSTRYEFQLSASKLQSGTPPAPAAAIDRLKALGARLSSVKYTGTASVGDDGFVHRLRMSLNLKNIGITGNPSGTVVSTFDYFDLGAPVDVTLPSANQVSGDVITTQDQLVAFFQRLQH